MRFFFLFSHRFVRCASSRPVDNFSVHKLLTGGHLFSPFANALSSKWQYLKLCASVIPNSKDPTLEWMHGVHKGLDARGRCLLGLMHDIGLARRSPIVCKGAAVMILMQYFYQMERALGSLHDQKMASCCQGTPDQVGADFEARGGARALRMPCCSVRALVEGA